MLQPTLKITDLLSGVKQDRRIDGLNTSYQELGGFKPLQAVISSGLPLYPFASATCLSYQKVATACAVILHKSNREEDMLFP